MNFQNGKTEAISTYMMQKIKHIYSAIFVIVFSLTSLSIQASTITSQDGNSSFKTADESNTLPADLFLVSKKNDAYISYNDFSDFVVDKPLQIFNLPTDGKAADLIVIHADEVILESSIEIIGPKTDILIVERYGSGTAGDGTVYCSNCSFANANRITLAALNTANENFSSSMLQVGELITSTGSNIILNKVNAYGALAFEVISSKIKNNGKIDLNQNMSDTGIGVYKPDLNGDMTAGTGTVNLFLGQYKWTYEESSNVEEGRNVISVVNVAGSKQTLGGSIEAPNVRIASTYPLTVNTNIDTRTDVLSTVLHRNVLKIVNENVTIETLKATASLELVDSSINSEGSVDLRSAQDMSISSYTTLEAAESDIVVADALYNFGQISSDNTYIASGSIANEGKILGKKLAEIHADDYVFNQYGGVIKSQEIILESESGIIRNGSKTPYKDTSSSANTLLSYSDNYIDELNASQLGAFYLSGVNVSSSSDNYVLAPVTSASILGNRVKIIGSAFENINPYYTFIDDNGLADIDVDKALQIHLSADEKLEIDVDNYILNSSALIEMNNSEGTLTMDAALVNNERYRVHTNLVSSSTQKLSTETVVFSLPGLIASLGNVNITASQSVLNNTAYMEIFGDLTINSPTVSSLGYELESFKGNEVINASSVWNYRYGSSFSLIQAAAQNVIQNITYRTQSNIEKNKGVISMEGQLDTLFFVDGDIFASEATGWFSNNKPLYAFAEERISQLIDVFEDRCRTAGYIEKYYNEENSDYEFWTNRNLTRDCTVHTEEYNQFYVDQSYTTEINEQTNELTVYLDHSYFETHCDYGCGEDENQLDVKHATSVSTYSVFDLLESYYDSSVDWLAEVYEEIRFW